MKKIGGFLLFYVVYVVILTVGESIAGLEVDFMYNAVMSAIFLAIDFIGYYLSQKFDKKDNKNNKKEE